MATIESLSLPKVSGFMVVFIGFIVLYYKKILDVDKGDNKTLQLMKHIFITFILFGLLSIFSTVTNITGKFSILVVIILLLNLYNISHSINKCEFKTLFKVNLIGRSSIIIIIIALLLYYSYEGDFFRFLYSKNELDSAENKYTVDDISDKLNLGVKKLPVFCPTNLNDSDYETSKSWKQLSPSQKKTCLATNSEINERKDINKKIYA